MDEPRADEFDEDLRRLMRSLGDPAALSNNRLARMLSFPGDDRRFVDALHAMIRSVLPEGSRLATVVELCDIQGLPHKHVAEELGLSMRQLYRERSKARDCVREALASRLYVRVERDGGDMLTDEFETQQGILDDGHTGAVEERVTKLLESGIPSEAVPAAIALRAAALADSGQGAAAIEQIERARSTASGDLDLAELHFAMSHVHYARGEHAQALVQASNAVERSAATHASPERRRRIHARHLHLLGNLRQECHEPNESVRALEHARALLQSCRTPPHAQLLRIAVDLTFSRFAVPGMLDVATAEAVEIYRSAVWHGVPSAVDWAEIALAFSVLAGARAAVVTPLRPASGFGATMQGSALARIKLILSRVRSAHRDPLTALALIREARTLLPEGHYLHSVANLRDAEALNALQRASAALPLAQGAIDELDFGSGSHYSGAAHMAVAEALSELGKPALAREHCEAGIGRLRHGALVHDLSRALRFAGRITGEARYAREAQQLQAG